MGGTRPLHWPHLTPRLWGLDFLNPLHYKFLATPLDVDQESYANTMCRMMRWDGQPTFRLLYEHSVSLCFCHIVQIPDETDAKKILTAPG